MSDMDERTTLIYLLDFYGPLLTPHRQEILRLYCEEDLTLQEIADELCISRQGVFEAIHKAREQLTHYEAQLGLVSRYHRVTESAERCKAALLNAKDKQDPSIAEALNAVETILNVER